MTKQDLVEGLSARLEEKKPAFLDDVRSAVAKYIQDQGKGCLTLIEHAPQGTSQWPLSAQPAYVARLIAFCREKPYRGHVIDSGLTEPVVRIVTEKFEKLYQQNSDEIAGALLQFIMEDEVLSTELVNAVLDSAGYASAAIRNRAASFLLEQLRHFMQSSAGQTITTFVGKTVAAAAAKPIGAQIAFLLIKSLSLQMKVIVAKVLASGAIKGLIAAAVKKFLIFAVAGAIVKAVAAKFGISALAAFMWVLIPVVIGYIAYEALVFPKQLAEKVSTRVALELSGKYAAVNREVLDKIVSQILDTGIAVLVRPLADSHEVQTAIRDFVESL